MKFSIIIPVYNTDKYLRKCLDSVLSQDCGSCEIILVNDGSTDNSHDICEQYAQKYDFITVYSKPNGGVSSARNFGTEHADGDYIYYLDSDDVMEEGLLKTIAAYPPSDCYFSCFEKTKNLATLEESLVDKIPQDATANMLRTKCSQISNIMCVKKIVKSVKFDERIRMSEDSMWLDEILDLVATIHMVRSPFFTYNLLRDGSATTTYKIDSLYTGMIAQKHLIDKNLANVSMSGEVLQHYVQLLWHITRLVYRCDNYKQHEAYQLAKQLRYTLKYTNQKVDRVQKFLSKLLGIDNGIRMTNYILGWRKK